MDSCSNRVSARPDAISEKNLGGNMLFSHHNKSASFEDISEVRPQYLAEADGTAPKLKRARQRPMQEGNDIVSGRKRYSTWRIRVLSIPALLGLSQVAPPLRAVVWAA
jgi:hypothetical protein